jgi:streptogramin lyase
LSDDVKTVAENDGEIWIGYNGNGISKMSDGEIVDIPTVSNFMPNSIGVFSFDDAGNVWMGGWSRILRYNCDSGKWVEFSDPKAAISSYVMFSGLSFDREGNLWFGGEDVLGICRFGHITPADEMISMADTEMPAYTRNIVADSKGDMWITSYNQGLYKYDFNTFAKYDNTEIGGMEYNRPDALGIDSDDNVWFSNHGYLVKYDNSDFTVLSVPLSDTDFVKTLAVDGDVVWLGTFEGKLYKYSDSKFTMAADIAEAVAKVNAVTDNGAVADGQKYDISGRKVINPSKGEIYIQNGKKIVAE